MLFRHASVAGHPQRTTARVFRAFLLSRYGPLLTHVSLVLLAGSMFISLLWLPIWIAIIPCAMIHHRVGILLHEYVHGIPFRRYKYNLWLLSAFEGFLISFGVLEVFRATHLAHHRWLNTNRDPAVQTAKSHGVSQSRFRFIWALEGPQHLRYFFQALQGKHPYIKQDRIVIGAVLSLLWIAFWFLVGLPQMPVILIALNLTTSVASSLRGALEHHSYPGDTNFANEYRVWIPLFRQNLHIDHHLDPTKPWYLREFRTADPLPALCYWTHWYHVYIKRDYVPMPPPAKQ